MLDRTQNTKLINKTGNVARVLRNAYEYRVCSCLLILHWLYELLLLVEQIYKVGTCIAAGRQQTKQYIQQQ